MTRVQEMQSLYNTTSSNIQHHYQTAIGFGEVQMTLMPTTKGDLLTYSKKAEPSQIPRFVGLDPSRDEQRCPKVVIRRSSIFLVSTEKWGEQEGGDHFILGSSRLRKAWVSVVFQWETCTKRKYESEVFLSGVQILCVLCQPCLMLL